MPDEQIDHPHDQSPTNPKVWLPRNFRQDLRKVLRNVRVEFVLILNTMSHFKYEWFGLIFNE